MSLYLTKSKTINLYKRCDLTDEAFLMLPLNEEIELLKKSKEKAVEWWYVVVKNSDIKGYIDWQAAQAHLEECKLVELIEATSLLLENKSRIGLEIGTQGYIIGEGVDRVAMLKFRTKNNQVGRISPTAKFVEPFTPGKNILKYISLVIGATIAVNYWMSLEKGFSFLNIFGVFLVSSVGVFFGLWVIKFLIGLVGNRK